jgi:hypothetical protein
MTGRSLPYRAVNDSTACPAVEAPAGGATAIDGGTIDGCVNVGGRLGIGAGPDDGARFIAGPVGASGTEAGGTGGGRSENICAEDGAITAQSNMAASANAAGRPLPRPDPSIPLPPDVMFHAFH